MAYAFDAKASERVNRIYQNPDIVEQRRVTLERLALKAGDHVLDIGCGPGLLAMDMAERVGPSGHVLGIDPSADMRVIAENRCTGTAWITIQDGDAIDLPCGDGSMDVVIATQVYEFVPDIEKALSEAHRVLKPGGKLAIIDTDWDSTVVRTEDPDRMRAVLESQKDHFVHRDLPGRLAGLLRRAGFTLSYAGGIPIVNTAMEPGTYSEDVLRGLAKRAAKRDDLPSGTAEAWLAELESLNEAGEYFFSLTRFFFVAVKS